MKKIQFQIFLIVVLFSKSLFGTDISSQNLILSYSLDNNVCEEAASMLRQDKACRQFDVFDRSNENMCSPEDAYIINIYGKPRLAFEEVSHSKYGFTSLFKSSIGDINGDTIIYIENFNGDKSARTIETWRVKTSEFEKVVEPSELDKYLEPYLISFIKYDNKSGLSEIFKNAEKINNDWSPVIEINGNHYLVERECSGQWVLGGIYSCNKIIKITIKEILQLNKTVPICQYIRKPSRQNNLDDLKIADEKLNNSYKYVINNSSENTRKSIQISQREWISFRNKKCKFNDKSINVKEAWLAFAASSPERAKCLIQEISNRTEVLISKYLEMKN